jgi:hypothetical protein
MIPALLAIVGEKSWWPGRRSVETAPVDPDLRLAESRER